MEPASLRLLFADDHALFRDALSLFLRRNDPNIEVICTETLDQTVEHLAVDDKFDLILLDLRMPGMFGLQGLQRLRTMFPKQRVAILSGTADEDDVRAALDMGAVAYYPKTMNGRTLLNAIRIVVDGEKYIAVKHDGSGLMPSYYVDTNEHIEQAKKAIEDLTDRERQVLGFLARGASNKEISNALNLQLPTIKLHVRSICRKLNTKNRTQAALVARLQSGSV